MASSAKLSRDIKLKPLSKETWKDFEILFGPKGACGGCWCMLWYLSRKEWTEGQGAGNKKGMKQKVSKGEIPGLIFYHKDTPIAWCAVRPREMYPRLEKSKLLKRTDDKPVWSIVCFFIQKEWRGKGLSVVFLEKISAWCKKQGAKIIEGYPTEPKTEKYPPVFAFTGFAGSFRKAGFKEIARPSETRPVFRKKITN